MFQFLQNNSVIRYFLVFVLILLGVAMLFFGNVSSVDPALPGDRDQLAKIKGTVITQGDFQQTYKSLFAFNSLLQGRMLDSDQRTQRMIQMQSWQWMLLLRGAQDLGIQVANQEVEQQIVSMPLFRREGKFDPELYQQVLRAIYSRYNLTEVGFEELMREQIAISRFERLMVAPVEVTQADVDRVFGLLYSPVELGVAIFPLAPFLKDAVATPEEIQALYDQNVDADPELRTPEQRQVEYVKFMLKPEDQKLEPGARARVLNALQTSALQFYQAMLPGDGQIGDFAAVAEQQGAKIQDSGLFAFDRPPEGVDPRNAAAFANAAYSLTPDAPLGRVQLQGEDGQPAGFAIMKLQQIAPTEALPLDKVKPLLAERIRQRKAVQMLNESAGASLAELNEKMRAGESFPDAAKELGLQTETLPSFVPGSPQTPGADNDKLMLVRSMAMQMRPGGVSPLLELAGGKGLMAASLLERGEPDNEQFGPFRSRIRAQLLTEAREAIIEEWIRLQMADPETTAPEMLRPEEPTSTGLEG
ncbi:MAG: SurA N-terminal domain-containing protein [Verrucomicrobiota bacterium]